MAKKIKGIRIPDFNVKREGASAKNFRISEVQGLARIINQRFYRLEKAKLASASYGYQVAEGELGRTHPRYSTSKKVLEKLSDEKLHELYLQLYQKEASPTTRIKGLQEMIENRINTSIKSLEESLSSGNKNVTIDKDNFIEFLESGGGELLNNKYLDSEQIIEDWLQYTEDTGVTTDEFLSEFRMFRDKTSRDYGKVRRNLKNLVKKKAQRKAGMNK